jgi:hypothetical protein
MLRSKVKQFKGQLKIHSTPLEKKGTAGRLSYTGSNNRIKIAIELIGEASKVMMINISRLELIIIVYIKLLLYAASLYENPLR